MHQMIILVGYFLLVTGAIASPITELKIEHNLGPSGAFTERPGGDIGSSVTKVYFSSAERDAFQELVKTGGMYQLRNVQHDLLTSIPACLLLASNFREEVTVHVTSSEKAMSMEVIPKSLRFDSPTTCPVEVSSDAILPESVTVITKLNVVTAGAGPSIPAIVETSVPPPAGMKKVVKEGEVPEVEQQSFFRKYWYVFAAFLLIQVLAPAEPEGEAGRGATAGNGGGSGAAATGRK